MVVIQITAIVAAMALAVFFLAKSSAQSMDSLVRALPFWTSVTAMSSVYTLFLAPIWNQGLYSQSFNMSVLQYRNVISAATVGSMITFLPGFLSQRIGARALLICAIAATLMLYCGLAAEYAVGDIVDASPSWKLVLYALFIGQSAAWVKMAAMANTIDSVHPSTVGKCLGFIVASFEVCNCFYTQVTEVWTTDLMFIPEFVTGPELISLRRTPIVFFLLLCVPGFYSLPKTSVLPDARGLSMHKLIWGSTLVWAIAWWNWSQQKGWCFFDTFGTMDVWHLFSSCICSYAVSLAWGVQIVTTGVVGALVVRARGWIPSVPPVQKVSEELEDAVLIGQHKEESPSEVPKNLFLCLALVGSVVIGTGQAVGNNYFWIVTSLHSDKFLGTGYLVDNPVIKFDDKLSNYAGMYMFSKIFASVHVMIPWDKALPRSSERTTPLVRTALIAAFSQLLLSLGHFITTDNTVLVFGLIGTGYATGAMNSLIVATSLDFYGRRKFVRVWSGLMALAALAVVIFFNGFEGLDMYFNHATSSDEYFDTYATATIDKCYWGGCRYRPQCIQSSMLVQSVACFAAAFAASLILKHEAKTVEAVDYSERTSLSNPTVSSFKREVMERDWLVSSSELKT